MEEKWKDIVGYEGRYQVSNLGRVKSLYDGRHKIFREKILKPATTIWGYLYVNLYKDGKMKQFKIHRLVALHFIPNPKNLREVNHIDEDKTNNCVTNLEWCTSEYNLTYNDRHKKVGEKNSIPVVQIDPATGKKVCIYLSAHEAERQGFNHGNITSCCKNKFNREGNNIYRGYKWQYLHDYIASLNPKISKVILMNKEYDF